MFTQGMKRWLQHVFAWWPWKRADEINYTQATGSLNRGAPQESPFRTTIDNLYSQPTRPAPQTIITISLDPTEDDEIPSWPPFTSSFSISASPVPAEEDDESIPFSELYDKRPTLRLPPLNQQPQELSELPPSLAPEEPLSEFVFSTQQRLKFLRYLVEQGIVSDDIR